MKRTPGATAAARERYWIGVISEARRYPRGVTAYCTAKNISKDNYYGWFRKLRPQHPEWKEDLNPPKQRRSALQANNHAESKVAVPQKNEVTEKARRRQFTAKYKAAILQKVAECSPRQIGAILRQEGLYASHLQKWRTEAKDAGLAPKKRGPKTNPLNAEVKRLSAELDRAKKQLRQANAIIDLQKKVSEILGISLQQNSDEH